MKPIYGQACVMRGQDDKGVLIGKEIKIGPRTVEIRYRK